MTHLVSVSLPGSIEKKYKKVFFGLDFGTTYSVIASCENGSAKVLTSTNGDKFIPSSVFLVNGSLSCASDDSKNKCIFRSIKRFVGRRKSEVEHLIYKMDDSGFVNIDGNSFSVFDCAKTVFEKLFLIAKSNYSDSLFECVVSVPSYYDDIARSQISKAALLSGFDVLRILNEPTAAAIAYGDNLKDGKYLVYDFGGGTFDLSFLEKNQSVIKVIGSFGDSFIGGDDVDLSIALKLSSEFAKNAEFVFLVKRAKEFVCNEEKDFVFKFCGQSFLLNIDLIKKCSKDLILKTIKIMEQAFLELDLHCSCLEGLIFVGGSTYLPSVKSQISEKFKDIKFIDNGFCRRTAVAVGASMHAYQIKNKTKLLIDVVPLSLGIEILGDVVEKIIHRNSPIPVVASRVFTTATNNCNEIRFTVCQGESPFIKDNKILKTFYMNDISKDSDGNSRVEITFRFDINGLLSVLAKDLISDKKVELSVSNVLEICSDL